MSDNITPFEDQTQRISRDPLDEVRVGDWYWVQVKSDFEDEDGSQKSKERLLCVKDIGSNHIKFVCKSEHGTHGWRIHFDNFYATCRREENWREYWQEESNRIQAEIEEKSRKLVEEGQALSLLPQDASESEPESTEALPTIVTQSPVKYKTDLVTFRDERMPAISKEIEQLAKDLAVTTGQLSLPQLVRLESIKSSLKVVEDRIFTVELYCGLQETVVQVADGNPAPMTTPVSIRQQLLYMDEETLFDYDDGGMDFQSVDKFDEWVAKPENYKRLAPEPRCVVAMKVRRYQKDYGTPSSLLQAWTQFGWQEANKQTYLLLRNGERVYRIATEIDFSPRLIPMRGEIGEEQFKKIRRRWLGFNEGDEVTEELITPDHLEYDDHVKKVQKLLKHYNRMVILIQGLLDRSKVFHPHPPIKLTDEADMAEWVQLIRDEEDGLPCNQLNWPEYRDQMNKTLKPGKYVYSKWVPENIGSYRGWSDNHKTYTAREQQVVERPRVCEVVSIRKDRSEVRIKWVPDDYVYGRYDKWGNYVEGHDNTRARYLWVPMEHVFNITDYNMGDYKMFLCDRALKGEYLEWAPFLLTAEDNKRVEQGRRPKRPRKGWDRRIVNVGGEDVVVDERDFSEDGE